MFTHKCSNGQRKQTRWMVNKVTCKEYLKRPQKRRSGFALYYFAVCLFGYRIAYGENVDDPLPERQDPRKTIIIRRLQHKYCVETSPGRALGSKAIENAEGNYNFKWLTRDKNDNRKIHRCIKIELSVISYVESIANH